MHFEPEKYLIFECIVGSRLYGTSTENSDTDYRGVCNTPLNVVLDLFQGFEQKDGGFAEKDRTIYDLGKFIRLCADSNPNIIEMLFIPSSHTLMSTPLWEKLIENKDLFLSKKAKYTFSGYAMSQLNDIKNHRQWFINPPKEKPTRKMFGLTDSPKVSGEGIQTISNIKFEYLRADVADELRRELEYREEKRKWDNYVSWRDNRNPERRRLEELYGYDVKHASHLFRLMTEGKELLLNGNITFPLPNCEEIRAIKNGKYQYDEVIAMSEIMDNEFILWYNQSPLSHSPNKVKLSELYCEIVMDVK